ncbi:hypothetical protein EVAR_57272_1 [Eumeta japonica]|uniref:Uncharacterized protein n=1 Tax=Eumeta variegata TaxID=151549 RepID=A0A4C1ZWQ2_EUMVA|nr:hypothetical protein EVAR_57272_1 [Eumeta japonica]
MTSCRVAFLRRWTYVVSYDGEKLSMSKWRPDVKYDSTGRNRFEAWRRLSFVEQQIEVRFMHLARFVLLLHVRSRATDNTTKSGRHESPAGRGGRAGGRGGRDGRPERRGQSRRACASGAGKRGRKTQCVLARAAGRAHPAPSAALAHERRVTFCEPVAALAAPAAATALPPCQKVRP